MAPREHGAYGQLFAPIGAALFSGHFSLASLAFAVAGMCAFYAHEPWLILNGQRGQRAARELLGPAQLHLAVLVGACLGFGVLGLIGSNHEARWAGVIIGMLGASALVMDRFEISRGAWGEVWAGAVLSSLGIPIGLSGGLPLRLTLAVALAWALAFAAGIFAVKGLITLRKIGSRGSSSWGLALVVVGLVLESLWSIGPVIAVMPLTLACIVTLVWSPPPKALRKIGWTLVSFTVLAAALLVVAVRSGRSVFRSHQSLLIRPDGSRPASIFASKRVRCNVPKTTIGNAWSIRGRFASIGGHRDIKEIRAPVSQFGLMLLILA